MAGNTFDIPMMIKRQKSINGMVILPTLLLLSSITLAIGLSFSFYSVVGVQSVRRIQQSAEALFAAQSGFDAAARKILNIFPVSNDGTDEAMTAIRDGLDALAAFSLTVPYSDGHISTAQVEICYNLTLGGIGTIDRCDGEVALMEIRIDSVGRSGNIYRALEAILAVDPLTYQLTLISLREIEYLAGDPPAIVSISGANPQGISGGQEITVTGSNFSGTPTVSVGSNAATDVYRVDSETLTAIAPAQSAAGAYPVTVVNPNEDSAACADCMTYRVEVAFEGFGSGSNTEGGSCTISVAWEDAEICVRVPTGALDTIIVRSNNFNSNSMSFTVE